MLDARARLKESPATAPAVARSLNFRAVPRWIVALAFAVSAMCLAAPAAQAGDDDALKNF